MVDKNLKLPAVMKYFAIPVMKYFAIPEVLSEGDCKAKTTVMRGLLNWW